MSVAKLQRISDTFSLVD
jgi:hypothetical protein